MQQITLNEQSTIKIINADNINYTIALNYNTSRQGWFSDLTSDNFNLFGIRLTSNYNVLKQWQNKLGFGLYIKTENNSEPFFYEDFKSGRATICLLESVDLEFQSLLLESKYEKI